MSYACLRQVKGVYDTAYPADGVQFVPRNSMPLRCTISVRRGFPVIALSHPATPGTCHAADFYRLGIEAEDSFAPIHFINEPLTDSFAEPCRRLPPVIVLPAGYEVGHLMLVFLQLGKQQGLAVDADRFRCQAKRDNLHVGKSRNYTEAGHTSLLIDQIRPDLLPFACRCREILRILHMSCACDIGKSIDWIPLIHKTSIICTTF